MTDSSSPVEEPSPKQSTSRWQTVSFISVFVVSVLLLLIGYRYAVDTEANSWYLFQVARHTTWALGFIGEEAELESLYVTRYEPKQVRATWQAWHEGRDAATPEELAAASDAPLTPWEVYRYRVEEYTRRDHQGTTGPHVRFVLTAGLTDRIQQAEAAFREANTNPPSPAAAELERQLADLRAEQNALKTSGNDAEMRAANRGHSFSFIVIPECGAIEVMSIFFAAVIAFPTRWWKRFVGLIVGLPLMYAVNIFRLSCLAVIGALDAEGHIFKLSHEYIWQAVYIVFVVAVWLAWIEFLVKRKS
jgi:exosortase/archaeosortase family protein